MLSVILCGQAVLVVVFNPRYLFLLHLTRTDEEMADDWLMIWPVEMSTANSLDIEFTRGGKLKDLQVVPNPIES